MKPKHLVYAALGCVAGLILYHGIPLLRVYTKLHRAL